MALFISFIFFILSIIGYIKDKRIINPLFIMPLSWALLLCMYVTIPHNLPALQGQFLLSISLWVLCFFLVSFAVSLYDFEVKIREVYNKRIFNLYFYIIIIAAPLALTLLVLEAIKVGPEMFFIRLRIINTGLDEEETFSLGPLAYVFNLSSVLALLFTYYIERISRWKYVTVIFLAFFLGLITLARTSIVGLSIGLFIVMYFKGRIKRKHYAYFGIVFLAFIILVTILRGQGDSQDTSFSDTFSLYIFGGMPAFDTLQFNFDDQFGGYTFRFFYAITNAFGGNVGVKQNILPYADLPTSAYGYTITNVYTILFPFYKDFGYYGIVIFGSFYGLLFGFIYKLAKQTSPFMILIYAFLFPCLLLQFMGESIFTNLSTYLQYAIILLILQRLKL